MAERLRTLHAAQFSAAHRLRHKAEFDLVYREGRRYSDSLFLVLARSNSVDRPRLGLSISSKAVGNAVSRNRIKRAVRESFRNYAVHLPSVDIVVNARPAAKASDNSALAYSLERLWDKLARHA